MRYFKKILALCTVATFATGCSSDASDLDEWMARERQTVTSATMEVAPPVEFVPEVYDAIDFLSPFSIEKLMSAHSSDSSFPACFQAQMDRRQSDRAGALEVVPIDMMHLVGTMHQQNRAVALIKVENSVYELNIGEYAGLDYGRVTRIVQSTDLAPAYIELVETLLTPEGKDCETRVVRLELQGGAG